MTNTPPAAAQLVKGSGPQVLQTPTVPAMEVAVLPVGQATETVETPLAPAATAAPVLVVVAQDVQPQPLGVLEMVSQSEGAEPGVIGVPPDHALPINDSGVSPILVIAQEPFTHIGDMGARDGQQEGPSFPTLVECPAGQQDGPTRR